MRRFLILFLFLGALHAQVTGTGSVAGTPAPGDTPIYDGTQFNFQNPPVTGTSNVNRLTAGCGVTYTTGLSFVVAPCTYSIAGITYNSALTTVTLTAADGSNPRIDAIIVDNTGVATKVTGTPAASPAAPSIDPTTQLQLTTATVNTSATTPFGVFLENVYLENTEWTCAASDGSNNCASTNNPFAGTKDIEGTTAARGDNVTLTRSTALILSNYNNLSFYIRSKATWPSNCNISWTWQNGSTQAGTGVTLSTGSFGFNSSQTSSYQLIVIPISAFGSIGQVTKLTFTVTGAGSCSLGYYIDNIILQGGISAPQAITGISPIVVSSNGVISCPTCGTSASNSSVGGIVGGSIAGNPAAANILSMFTTTGATARLPMPSNMWFTQIATCTAAATTVNQATYRWVSQALGGGAEVESQNATTVLPGAAAGCYLNTFSAPTQISVGTRWRGLVTVIGTPAVVGSWVAGVVGSTSIPLGQGLNSTVALSTTIYTGYANTPTLQADEELVKFPLVAGVLQNFCITTSTTQNAGGTLVATVRIAAADTALVMTVTAGGTAGSYCDYTHRVNVTDGQVYDVKLVNNYAGGVSANIVGITGELIPTTPGAWLLPFSKNSPGTITASSTAYWQAFSGGNATDATEANARTAMVRNVSVTAARCWIKAAPGTASTTFTVYKNGVATALTGSVTTGFSAPGLFTMTGGPIAYNQLDSLSLESVTGAGTSASLPGCVVSGQ